jgi:hypothetical protein
VKLVDFNPFGKTTDSLLYSWDEFDQEILTENTNGISDSLELRLIEHNYGIISNQYGIYGQPKEAIETILNPEKNTECVDNLTTLINKVII